MGRPLLERASLLCVLFGNDIAGQLDLVVDDAVLVFDEGKKLTGTENAGFRLGEAHLVAGEQDIGLHFFGAHVDEAVFEIAPSAAGGELEVG